MRRKANIPERLIAELIASGRANKEIAIEIGVSPETVKWYIHKMLKKYQCGNRTELAFTILSESLTTGTSEKVANR